eukprot:scaffold56811_cov66-Phaeocystis_antarctica.AAC.6
MAVGSTTARNGSPHHRSISASSSGRSGPSSSTAPTWVCGMPQGRRRWPTLASGPQPLPGPSAAELPALGPGCVAQPGAWRVHLRWPRR